VICGAGPGSFTSLRIAASIAKGLTFAAGCPLFAISSLALLAAGTGAPFDGRYLAVLDALRGEAYVGGYSFDSRSTPSVILPERIVRQEDVATVAASIGATTIGPGQRINVGPRARALSAIESLIAASRPVDLSSWEPDYGRKAEAQMRWEAAHGRPLPGSGTHA
jgi:tRNA threonylcarbamoyladenosine biosynthesis protein TsaB